MHAFRRPLFFFVLALGLAVLSLALPHRTPPRNLDAGFVPAAKRGGVAQLDAEGRLLPNFPAGTGFNGDVLAILKLPDGQYMIGGDFTEVNGVPRNRLARLNADGTLDQAFDPGTGPGDAVEALAFDPATGSLYAGGVFHDFNDMETGPLVRLDANGTLDETFLSPGAPKLDGAVFALAFDGGGLIVGGERLAYDEASLGNIARLNAAGELDKKFAGHGGFDGDAVYALAVDPATRDIFAGGDFNRYGHDGHEARNLARLNPDGSFDRGVIALGAFRPQGGAVRALAVDGQGRVIAGGDFSYGLGDADQRVDRLARFDADLSFDGGFHAAAKLDAPVNAVLASGADVVIGGEFSTYGAAGARHLASLDADGNLNAGFTAQAARALAAPVYALALNGANVVLGMAEAGKAP